MPPQINLIFPGKWNILYRTCVHTVHRTIVLFLLPITLVIVVSNIPFFFGGLIRRRFQKHPSFCVCVYTHFSICMYSVCVTSQRTHFRHILVVRKNYFHWEAEVEIKSVRRVCCRADEIWYVWDPTQSRSKALTDVGRWVPGGVNSVSADVRYYQRLYSSSILDIYNVRSR